MTPRPSSAASLLVISSVMPSAKYSSSATQRRPALSLKRPIPRHQLVQDDAERKDVGSSIDLATLQLFGRQVRGRAHHQPVAGQGCAARCLFRRLVVAADASLRSQLCEAEVQQLHAPVRGHHDVGRFEISMDDAFVVGRREGIGDRNGQVEELGEQKPLGRNLLVEAHTVHALHHQNAPALELLDTVDGHDVGVVERSHRFGLAAEPLQALGVFGHLRRQHFEGHFAVELRVEGLVDLAHTATTQPGGDPEVGELTADQLPPGCSATCEKRDTPSYSAGQGDATSVRVSSRDPCLDQTRSTQKKPKTALRR